MPIKKVHAGLNLYPLDINDAAGWGRANRRGVSIGLETVFFKADKSVELSSPSPREMTASASELARTTP